MTKNIVAKKRKLARRSRSASRDGPHPVDVHVGSRVRTRRTLLGMSQTALAEALRLTFQQVQKYERGANRVSASRLHEISRILDVPVAWFFEDMDEATAAATSRVQPGKRAAWQSPTADIDPLAKRESLQLVRAYYRIADPGVRTGVFELTKALGNTVRER